MEIGIELNKDGTGSITTLETYTEIGLDTKEKIEEKAEDDEINIEEILSHRQKEMKKYGAKVNIEPIEYMEGESKYSGTKEVVKFKDRASFYKFYKDQEGGDIVFKQLGNDVVRMELSIKKEDIVEDEEILHFLVMTGAQIKLSFKTDNKIIDSNADEIKNGVHTWDIIYKMLEDEKILLYVKFIDEEIKEVLNEGILWGEREEVEKNLQLDKTSPDFHGKALEKMKILTGSDKGLELDRPLTRVEGAVVYSRMLVKGNEIEEFNEKNRDYNTGFDDVPQWAVPTINYLHSKNLVAGVSKTSFGSSSLMAENQYATLVLRALGFNDAKGDFEWSTADKKLKEIGLYKDDLIKTDEILTGQFNRIGMAYITYNALFYKK